MTKKDTLKKGRGLYIHVPFCRTRCVYCGFYSTTYDALKDEYVAALLREMNYRCTGEFSTLYLGGGTPSQLSIEQLASVVEGIDMMTDAERTIECNPDDISRQYAEGLRSLGFNRVSLGVQSFDRCQLEFLRRRHDAEKVFRAIEQLRAAGFSNISIDLMYGLPGQSVEKWRWDVDWALSLDVEHISCYCLTYENGTPLYNMRERGEVKEVDDETARQMYFLLIDKLTAAGFEHYEISNFAKPGYRSRHNSAYWNGIPYIGIGAGAHSYDGKSRSWNVCDVEQYIGPKSPLHLPQGGEVESLEFRVESLENGSGQYNSSSPFGGTEGGSSSLNPSLSLGGAGRGLLGGNEGGSSYEMLTDDDMYNELVMTRLRTADGLLIDDIPSQYVNHFNLNAKRFVDEGFLVVRDGRCCLSRKALFVSDAIISSLFKA